MGRLDDRVAIVTGAGGGMGRCHALLLAAEGAKVVVNDVGGDVHGHGADATPAERVVEEIRARGGQAVASAHDVSSWTGAEDMVGVAIDSFGDLHVLVNNAGILRDRMLANMTEEEWDDVVRVHLKGHAAPTRHAVAYWRRRSKESGAPVKASVIHTTSMSGILGNLGQASYAAAKAGIIALSKVLCLEAARYGVRSNVISPVARTRLSATVPGSEEAPDIGEGGFDALDPAHVSPLVAWLAAEECAATNQVLHIFGDQLWVVSTAQMEAKLSTTGRWTLEDLDRQLPGALHSPVDVREVLGEIERHVVDRAGARKG